MPRNKPSSPEGDQVAMSEQQREQGHENWVQEDEYVLVVKGRGLSRRLGGGVIYCSIPREPVLRKSPWLPEVTKRRLPY